MSGGAWSYNRFDLYEKKKAEKQADKDYDGDGKVESSKDEYFGSKDKAIKKAMGKDTKKESKDDCDCKHEGASITKDDVLQYLMNEGFANNEVSAEVIFEAISDEFLCAIEEQIEEGFKPLPKDRMARQAGKAYNKEQQAVAKGDESGANKQMQRRIAMTNPAGRKAQLMK